VLLDAQCAVLNERGLFAAHPDRMDERLFRRASDGAFVAGWLGRLGSRDGDVLLAEAGLADEFISLPACAFRPGVCAHCGADVASIEGAATTVCGGCGRCLEAERTFECRGCSAPVLRSEAEPATSCAYCGMRWEAVGG
jgi:DNA-directed RNA polymerase subunit RPC12/RpoP